MGSAQTLLIGGMAGIIGTGLGGLLGYTLKKPSSKLVASLMGFSGGLMVAVVCFDLLPEGYNLAGFFPTLSGVFLGVALMSGVQYLMERENNGSGLARAGILISIGIALHNLPEGLAIGAGFSRTPSLGFSLCAAIALHDIPEGLSMAVPLRAASVSALRVVLYTLLAGVPTALGVVIGYAVGSTGPISETLVSGCMGIAAGAMLYVVAGEIIPDAQRLYDGHATAFLWVLGLICGSAVSIIL